MAKTMEDIETIQRWEKLYAKWFLKYYKKLIFNVRIRRTFIAINVLRKMV